MISGMETQPYSMDLDFIRGGIEDFFDLNLKGLKLAYFDLEDTLWERVGYIKAIGQALYKHPEKRNIPKRDVLKLRNHNTIPVSERIELTVRAFQRTPLWILEWFGNYMANQINPFSQRFLEALYGIPKLMMSYDISQFTMPTKEKLEQNGIEVGSYLVNGVGLDEQERTTLELFSVAHGVPDYPRTGLRGPDDKLAGLLSKMDAEGIEDEGHVIVFNDRNRGEWSIDKRIKNVVKSDQLPDFFKYLASTE